MNPLRWSLCLATMSCLFIAESASAQVQANGAANDAGSVIRPATRELRQLLNRARKALDEQDYPAAVQALEELLTDPTLDDYFLAAPGQPDSQTSVKTVASQLLGSLPAGARQLYETQVGHEARRQLNDALRDRNLAGVAEVARRYVHTKAGYEATFLLGRLELDQGRALAAAILLQPLCEQGSARDLLDPELSVLTATAWNHARRGDKATELLVALKTRTPRIKVRLQEGEQPLFDNQEDALKWLEQIAGRGLAPTAAVASQWIMFRGDEARNAASSGGMPLVISEWYNPTTNDLELGNWVAKYARTLQDKGESIVPVLQPLAVAAVNKKDEKRVDYVVVRSPEKVMGVSLRNGKRMWVYPHNDATTSNAERLQQGVQQTAATKENAVRQRIWDDNLYGQMSSDGNQLYFIDDLEFMNTPTINQMRGVWIGGRPPMGVKGANKLTALNLRRQGTLCWTVGGEGGGEDANLAGAFFLGAPIAVAEKLYVLAEFNGELRLLCLSPETGTLEWKQQLGSVPEETLTIRYDATRRLAGASPSFADGVLVCPTSAGTVVAVDLGTRSLKWNYTYDRNDLNVRLTRGVITSSSVNNNTTQGKWLDSSAIIAEGSVIITPVESQALHCVDLITGKPRWAPLKRDDGLFVACIHKGKIILVGKKNVRAINISDGKDAWTTPIDLNNEIASGRGFYNGTHYYVPTTGQQLLKLDLDAGKVAEKCRTEFTLGNLVSFEGEMISVGHDQMAAFYFVDHMRSLIEKDLAANPGDVRAVARLGELLLTEGKTQEALTSLRQAYKAHPGDARIRGLLARVMLVLLRTDFVNHHDIIPEARMLIEDAAQRRELLRLQAVGMHKAGLVAESLEAFVTLADELQTELGPDEGGNSQMEYIDSKWQVRTSRWLQARLTELYTSSSDADRAKLQERLEQRLAATLKSDSLKSARRFVEVYGFHPLADRARLLLVQKLLLDKSFLEAELRAGDLLQSSDPAYRAAGLAALVETYDLAQRPHLAAERFAEFTAAIGSNPVTADHPASAMIAKVQQTMVARLVLKHDSWPGGRAQKVEQNAESVRARPYMNNFSVMLNEFTGPAPRGMRAVYDPSQQALQVVDSLGKTIAQAPIRRSDGVYRTSYSIPYSGLLGRATGHIVAVHTGGEILAIDALRPNRGPGEPILWRAEVVNVDPLMIGRAYPQSRQTTNPITGSRTMAFDQSGQTNYQPGPVTLFGIVYQRSRQLICADPITGETLWERSGVELASDLFGDEDYVFAVAPNSDQASVFSMRDGALLGTRTVPRSSARLATNGRRVLAWEQVGNTVRLRLFDAWNEKAEDLWKLETTTGTKGQLLDGNEFALLENSGKFTVLSLVTGEPIVQSQLQAETTLSSLHVYRSQEQYTVLANTPISEMVPGLTTQPLTGGGMPGQQAHGRVYAIDRVTGKQRWQSPAFIAQHGLPFEQPVDSPLLVFIRNRRGNNSGNWTSNLLCLDKRNGAVAYEGDIATAQANMCEVQADLEKQIVQVTAWVQPGTMRMTTIKLTDEPQPPQPPAQTGMLSSLTAGQPTGTPVNVADGIFDPNRPGNAPAAADPFAPARQVIIGPNGQQIPIPPNMPAADVERLKELIKRAEQQRQAPPPQPVPPRPQPNIVPPAPRREAPAPFDDPFK